MIIKIIVIVRGIIKMDLNWLNKLGRIRKRDYQHTFKKKGDMSEKGEVETRVNGLAVHHLKVYSPTYVNMAIWRT